MKRTLPIACWLTVFAAGTMALGQARPPAVLPTTQQATIVPTAFDPNDPDVTPELAKAVEPKRVTLKVQNMPPLTAMAEIAKQTGYEIRPADDNWFNQPRQKGSNVTISIENEPFWVVIREVGSRGNINLYNSGGDDVRAVQLSPGNYGGGGMMRAAASIRGPFMVCLSNLQRINSVNMASPQNIDHRVQISINTFVEPKVNVSQVSYEPVVEEATDDNGNSMKPAQRPENENRNMQSARGISFYGNLSLPYPANNPGKRIARIKGYLPATLNLAAAPIEIADPLKAAEADKTVGKRKVTFKSLKKEGTNYMLELTFYKDDQERPLNELFNESLILKLTDAQGKTYRYYNSGGSGGQDSVTRRFTFQPRGRNAADTPGEPVKLVMEIPTGSMDIAIPFELVNLPLP